MKGPQLWVWMGAPDDKLDVLRYARATKRDILRQPIVEAELDRIHAEKAALWNRLNASGERRAWCPEHHIITPVEDRAGRYRCSESGCTCTVRSTASAALEMSSELARIQRLPALDWAQATAEFTQHLASLARGGEQPAAKKAIETLDKLKTYVNRVEVDRDSCAEGERQMQDRLDRLVSANKELRAELAEATERAERADQKSADQKSAELRKERDLILKERPALLKEGWKMPDAPKCKSCGASVVAVAYYDCSEVSFHWDEWCDKCENETGASTDGVEFDDWPFAVDTVWTSDLERVGFRVE